MIGGPAGPNRSPTGRLSTRLTTIGGKDVPLTSSSRRNHVPKHPPMSTTRLRLDFTLTTNTERVEFLNRYLQSEIFRTKPPTDDELEMMGNYVLWGKDPVTGLNAQQEGITHIETKHRTWDRDPLTESLDGLLEMPTFSEATLRPMDAIPIKTKKPTFDRKAALDECPDHLRPVFDDLFARIDELDLAISIWEVEHGKRKKPPRPSLLKRFANQLDAITTSCRSWSQYKWLKKRHELVELRREAYTLRDAFRQTVVGVESAGFFEGDTTPQIDVEIEVLPLGTWTENRTRALIFQPWDALYPANFGEDDLAQISQFLWAKKAYAPSANQRWLDFRNPEHVGEMLDVFFELEDAAIDADLESNLPALMRTLDFYVRQADLTEVQREILDLKLKKVKNADIASAINRKWGKTYTTNYISTIFRQRIIPKINEAAAYHEKIVGSLFFEEEFKTCSVCGRTLLRDTENFTRKTRSPDGFTARCKKCEKESRKKHKENDT